ncbi:flippase-like domain-containing protein [Candidatus Woesearchaeota archaeon]|nr:flippase-like domain-containing protein [Candidatus Woesearchaeota archaeon]
MISMKKSNLLSYFLLLLGISVLIYFLTTLDINSVKIGLKSLDGFAILFILFLTFLTVVIKAFRWQYLIVKATGKEITGWFSFLSIIAGVAVGSITPARAGEVAKPIMLKNTYGIRISETLSFVFSERAFDLLALIALFFLGLLFLPLKLGVYRFYTGILFSLFILLILILFIFPKHFKILLDFFIQKLCPDKWKLKCLDLNKSVFAGFSVLKKKDVAIMMVLTSFLSMVVEVFRLLFILTILGVNVNFWSVSFAFAVSVIFGILTMVPGGIGTTEVSQMAVLGTIIGLSNTNLLKLGVLLDRFFAYYLLVGIGSVVLIGTQKWKKKKEKNFL